MSEIVRIGPYHPYLLEPELFELRVEDGVIRDVDVRIGYAHRGIEKVMTTKTYEQAVFVSSRVCGICPVAHTTCYCETAERLLGIRAPDRARYIRTAFQEINRLQSHFLWLALLAHALHDHERFMHIMKEREAVVDLLEFISGARSHHAMNVVGGVLRDFTPKITSKIREVMNTLKPLSDYTIKMLEAGGPIGSKVEGVGPLSRSDAIRLGAVGPVLRGSGVKSDVRSDDPYAAYGEVDFEVVAEGDGDVRARAMVRARETAESIRIVEQALENMPEGPIRAEYGEPTVGEELGRVEAPRGELIYYMKSNGTNRPERVKIRTPTYANIYAITRALTGEKLENARAIIESIDPCFACTDRVVVVDVKTGMRSRLDVC